VAEEYHGLHKKLVDRFGKGGDAAYTFVTCALAMAVSGFAAFLFNQGLLFPSLGPTVFLFFETPMAEMASPRNTLIGHFVAVLAGALSLAIFGLLGHPSILQEGVTLTRVGAGALSVALTGAVLLLLRSSHPPTGATTLIVSLGLLQTPHEMVMLMVGVVLLTVVGWTINRALGVPMPVWSAEGSTPRG
jgi:CBS-domain-containing membrane protein